MNYGVESISRVVRKLVGDHQPIMDSVQLKSTGAEYTLESGTVLGVITAEDKHVQLDPAAADGSDAAVCVLAMDVTVPAADDEAAPVYIHGEMLEDGLIWPDGITEAEKKTAIAQLRGVGLFVI